ncbi:cytidylyltransferase domain-containing protein [Lysinibacillus fusiformis]|uniref:acylneuraminate cytidylyltransferase family protein n=1 Tax=Lysinibacillus fusiformis TaxID=28031 RepID=UPI0011A69E41|nr:acylneuraminate cytidylyltransferase family protein [Lysinibacillus fusiformis]
MIGNKKVLALIPARGGSKSIPHKNIVNLYGKPLIAWTIETALNTLEIDKVIVSTDDLEIARIATEYGADVQMRPTELATDTSLVIDTMHYVINELKKEQEYYTYIVLLEATAPFRTVADVSKCIKKVYEESLDSVATFKEAELNPNRAWKIKDGTPTSFIDGVIPWLPRQQLPEAYQLNGAVYVTKIEVLLKSNREIMLGKIGAVTMPKERSIDIDDKMDLLVAELLLKKQFEK